MAARIWQQQFLFTAEARFSASRPLFVASHPERRTQRLGALILSLFHALFFGSGRPGWPTMLCVGVQRSDSAVTLLGLTGERVRI